METLRDFALDLATKMPLRAAVKLIGLQREAFRKFVRGKTETPHDATRKLLAEAYLAVYRGGAGEVREARSEVPLPTPDEFRMIFENREDAHRKFAELFSQIPDEKDGTPPGWVAATHHYLKRLANAAFAGEPATYPTRSRPTADDEGEAAKKKAAKKALDGAAKKDGEGAKKKPPAKPRKKKPGDADGGET